MQTSVESTIVASYEQRIVGFVDVLGWSAACKNPSNFGTQLATVKKIADYAQKFSPAIKGVLRSLVGASDIAVTHHASVEFSYFSDNFAVSAPIAEAETLLDILAWASHEILHAGFLSRGGIALGALHHDPKMIFGPALIEAVDLEKEAIYPRLLCGEQVRSFLDKQVYKDRMVLSDEDNMIVNIARGSEHALADLLKIVERELAAVPTCSKEWRKWRYLQRALPRMYQARGNHGA